MFKRVISTIAFAVGLAAAQGAQAVTIGYSTCAAGDGSVYTTCVSGATVEDFEGVVASGYTGNGSLVTGNSSGFYAAPAGDVTRYLTVPINGSTGTVTAIPGGSFNYFGLYWGSMDGYNTLAFYHGGSIVTSVTGADVITALSLLGNQTNSGSNRYVDFYFGSDLFDEVRFTSTQYAFESDNHAFANVPEPGTLALLGLGLMGLGFCKRRKHA